MDKKTAYEIVYNDLSKLNMFMGTYDAKNGSELYMYGISAVMENIAYHADKLEEFEKIFFENIEKSVDKAQKK